MGRRSKPLWRRVGSDCLEGRGRDLEVTMHRSLLTGETSQAAAFCGVGARFAAVMCRPQGGPCVVILQGG